MTQDEKIRMKLIRQYTKEAAAHGVESAGSEVPCLELFDYSLSYLRLVQDTWNAMLVEGSVEVPICVTHITVLDLCIEDTVRGRQVWINDQFTRLMASPTKEGARA